MEKRVKKEKNVDRSSEPFANQKTKEHGKRKMKKKLIRKKIFANLRMDVMTTSKVPTFKKKQSELTHHRLEEILRVALRRRLLLGLLGLSGLRRHHRRRRAVLGRGRQWTIRVLVLRWIGHDDDSVTLRQYGPRRRRLLDLFITLGKLLGRWRLWLRLLIADRRAVGFRRAVRPSFLDLLEVPAESVTARRLDDR